jgi:arabinose-5-phosphate isomerase
MNENIDISAELRRVLDIEIEGLRSARENLNDHFVAAVKAIADCAGHIFVSGIGKSGIIATKIAATLRSTGTAATFLHAGEALHGDLGTVGAADMVLAIGKSGETSELNSLLRILRRNGTFIIAMTSNGASSMAALADITLEMKIAQEACPLNLAPTTSTTVALAIGDAIAVTLMKLKNISAEDFARHHPAGQIGARLLLTVRDVMRKGDDNPVVPMKSSMKEMLVRITAFRVGAISIIDDDGRLLGLVTDYDVRRILEAETDFRVARITDVMNPAPLVIDPDRKAIEALEIMKQRKKPTAVLPVVDGSGKVVGMIHLHDLLSAGL